MMDERFIYDGNGVPRPNPAFPKKPPAGAAEQATDEDFEQRVVAYLLGELTEADAEQFEDECFAQECWPEQIEAVENALIDEYLHRELSPEQHRLFEQNYLTTEGRQTRVRTAAAMLRKVCAAAVPDTSAVVVVSEKVVPDKKTWAFWGQWQFQTAFAVVASVIVVGGFWLYQTRVRSPLVVATLKLTSSVSNRSGGGPAQTIKLPANAGALRVSLMLPNNSAPASRYRVELDTEDGKTIPLDVAEQDAQSVSVIIPAAKLAPGEYALTLLAINDDGSEQRVYGSYIFTVE